jgi:hypothetical protein
MLKFTRPFATSGIYRASDDELIYTVRKSAEYGQKGFYNWTVVVNKKRVVDTVELADYEYQREHFTTKRECVAFANGYSEASGEYSTDKRRKAGRLAAEAVM